MRWMAGNIPNIAPHDIFLPIRIPLAKNKANQSHTMGEIELAPLNNIRA